MAKRKDRGQSKPSPSTKQVDGGWDESGSFAKGANPFAALLGDAAPAAAPAAAADEKAASKAPEEFAAPKRATVHVQRKGRGGKTVTIVSHLGFTRAEYLEHWCTVWRQKLGCGGQVEQEEIVLQGDQRARMRAILEALGVTRIAGA